jgi:hypothetical protein
LVKKMVIVESRALVIGWAYKHSPLQACDGMFGDKWVARLNSDSFFANHDKQIARIDKAYQKDEL